MSTAGDVNPPVAILLSTFNGAHYLSEQLESYTQQTHKNWCVFASDDGSQDDTVTILRHFGQTLWPNRVEIRSGPGQGFIANFLSLACDRAIAAEYFAYSDQDDLWEADKLERAINWLRALPKGVPGLYCSRTCIIDAAGKKIGFSPLFPRTPGIRNALVQNIAGGNTMVFNDAARQMLRSGGPGVQVPAHDWWTYLIVSATGGKVKYDPRPSVRYRNHTANLIGSNQGAVARMKRLRMLASGQFREWTDMNIKALKTMRPLMSDEAALVFECFRGARRQPLLQRLAGLVRSGVYRQTIPGNIALSAAAFLNKI